MNYQEYQNDLNKLLESEILGEAVFLSAAEHAKSPQQK